MKCPGCGYCGACGTSTPGAPAGQPPVDRRHFQVYSGSVRIDSDGSGDTSSDVVQVSVEAAAAVDVFIRYRNPATGSTTNPAGTEQWKVWAVTGMIRSYFGTARATTEASTDATLAGQDGFPLFRILAIRDVPAERFDISLNTLGVAAGTTLFFDVVVIAWGKEPTGIGPLALSTFLDGDTWNATANTPTGLVVLAKTSVSAGGGVWRSLSMNQRTFSDVATADGVGWLNVLGGGVHNATLPTVADGYVGPLQLDDEGRLIVNVGATGGSTSVSRSTSAAYESSRVHSGAARVQGFSVFSKAAAAGYIFLFDAAALPANGTLPDYPPIPIAVGAAAGAFVSVDFGEEPRNHASGFVVAFSSTAATLTLGTADCWIEVEYF